MYFFSVPVFHIFIDTEIILVLPLYYSFIILPPFFSIIFSFFSIILEIIFLFLFRFSLRLLFFLRSTGSLAAHFRLSLLPLYVSSTGFLFGSSCHRRSSHTRSLQTHSCIFFIFFFILFFITPSYRSHALSHILYILDRYYDRQKLILNLLSQYTYIHIIEFCLPSPYWYSLQKTPTERQVACTSAFAFFQMKWQRGLSCIF